MRLRRVVVTGLGAVSPFGRGMAPLMDGLNGGRSGIGRVDASEKVGGLRCLVGGLVPGIDERAIPRKHRRSMSPMSVYSLLAALEALEGGKVGPELLTGGTLGVSIGSTVGSTRAMEDFFADYMTDHVIERMRSTLFFQIMNHSCAANTAHVLGITGRLMAPSSACATGGQAVGLGYETIARGRQELMICGGADEFHPLVAATFDIMNAASTRFNDDPRRTPRPFDRDRDGVVCSEGAGMLLLESLDSALARGAEVLAEVLGFATVTDPTSIVNPHPDAIEKCMRMALADAGTAPGEIGYVNAHATATPLGDVAEAEAIARVFGRGAPVSSLKGHLGHTMAASGSLELAAVIEMLRQGRLVPTLNLEDVDPGCDSITLMKCSQATDARRVLKNNFALGGVNSSVVIGRYTDDRCADR
jgi:3-oxoacyl-[acyl-carrier-protein] synthase II